jgi:two-component system cell cycle sensor histidine kinase/response regulator CckA
MSRDRKIRALVTSWIRTARNLFTFLKSKSALLESRHQFQLLVDSVVDFAIFMLDAEGQVKSWSIAAEKMFGYSSPEILGRFVGELYPPDQMPKADLERELRIAATHGRFEEVKLRLRKEGVPFWANTVFCPLLDNEGNLRGFSCVVRDITERKQAEETLRMKEEELYQARKMEAIGRLAGGVAHDFNNLITGIIGVSEEVYDNLPQDDAMRSDVIEIIKAANRAADLTKQLLAFGRRQIASPQVVNLNTVIVDLSPMMRRLIGADVELSLHLAPDLGNIKIDPAQLEQILINLVMNARDAMPSGGTIRIETLAKSPRAHALHRMGPHVGLIISDTGMGMNDETCHRIFEPFFTTKPRGQGTGLGLATVYGIVKQNQGDITVSSQQGVGTSFQIVFPESQEPAATVRRWTGIAPVSVGRQATVLVVEDEDIVRLAVTRALRKAEYQVLTASNAAEVKALCDKYPGPIHLLLTDVVMPGMNGRELAAWMYNKYPNMAVLYMSGYPEDVVLQRGILEPGIDFIEKSFAQSDLLQKVAQTLQKANAGRPRSQSIA